MQITVGPDGDRQTLQEAFDIIADDFVGGAPDEILLQGGCTYGPATLRRGGTTDAPLVIRPEGNEPVTIDGGQQANCLRIEGQTEEVQVRNLRFTNCSGNAISVMNTLLERQDPDKYARYIEFDAINVSGLVGRSAILAGGDDITVRNSVLSGQGSSGGEHGIYVSGNHSEIYDNTIEDWIRAGIRGEGNGHIWERNRIKQCTYGISIWVDKFFADNHQLIDPPIGNTWYAIKENEFLGMVKHDPSASGTRSIHYWLDPSKALPIRELEITRNIFNSEGLTDRHIHLAGQINGLVIQDNNVLTAALQADKIIV